MFHHVRKEDIVTVLDELGEPADESCKLVELKKKLLNTKEYVEDPEFVKSFLSDIVERRKNVEKKREEEEGRKIEEERLIEENRREEKKREDERFRLQMENEKLKIEKESVIMRLQHELELARIAATQNERNRSPSPIISNNGENELSLDKLIKGVITLTIPVPRKSESWNLFFESLERAFKHKNVPADFKAEILLKLLGDKASNVLVYIEEDDLKDYEKVKKLILKEFEPSPQTCLEHFQNATRNSGETHIQLSSRLTAMWEYYCKLRGVNDLKSLKELIISDKMFQLLDKETSAHIAVRQGENWLKPQDLARECDVYFGAQRKSFEESRCVKAEYEIERSSDKYVPPQRRREELRYGNNSFGRRSCFGCGSTSHVFRECLEKRKVNETQVRADGKTVSQNKENIPKEEILVARIGKLNEVQMNEEVYQPLQKTKILIDNKAVDCIIDSGCQMSALHSSYATNIENRSKSKIIMVPAFGNKMEADAYILPVRYKNQKNNVDNVVNIRMAVTDKLNVACLLSPFDYEKLTRSSGEIFHTPDHEEKCFSGNRKINNFYGSSDKVLETRPPPLSPQRKDIEEQRSGGNSKDASRSCVDFITDCPSREGKMKQTASTWDAETEDLFTSCSVYHSGREKVGPGKRKRRGKVKKRVT